METRGQTGEMTNLQKLQSLQAEIRSKMKGVTSNTPQQQANLFQEDFRQIASGRKSPSEQQVKSPSSAFISARTPISQAQRSISQGKFQNARMGQQSYTPKSPSMESAKENLQILQQKLKGLRQGEEQQTFNYEKTQEDIYAKMRAAIPKPTSLYTKNQNQIQQQTKGLQKLTLKEEFQEYRPQSQAISQKEKQIQESKSEFEERWQKLANKKSDFKNPEIPLSKAQSEVYEPYEAKNIDYKPNFNLNRKYTQDLTSLQQILSPEKIREVQTALVECSDGYFGKLSPS